MSEINKTEEIVKKIDVAHEKDNIIDETEAKDIAATLSKITTKDVADFLSDGNNQKKYEAAMTKVQKSIDAFSQKTPSTENNPDENPLTKWFWTKPSDLEIILTGLEKNINSTWARINKDPNSTWINTLLGKENTSFWVVFEQSSEVIKNELINTISKKLLQDPFLSEKGKLTTIWEDVQKELLKEITKERSDNITFVLLEEIFGKYENKIEKFQNNKEKLLEEKVSLLLNIKKTLKNWWLQNIKNSTNILSWLDITRDTLKSFESNMNTYLQYKIKEWGFDMTSKETKKESITKDKTWWEKVWLGLSGKTWDKTKQAVLNVVPDAFKHAFEDFDDYENTKIILWQISITSKENPFDPSKIKTIDINNNTDKPSIPKEKVSELMKKLSTLAEDLPVDPKSQDAKNLKEMMMNNKVDALLDKLPLKEIWGEWMIFEILKLLDSLGGPFKDLITWLFGKAFGLEKDEVKKLLNRPYITSWINYYKNNLQEIQKGENKDNYLKLDQSEDWKLDNMDYFRLQNGLVYQTTTDSTTGKKTWKLQKIDDKTGNVIDLNDSDKDKKLYNQYKLPEDRSWNLEDFILKDIYTAELTNSFALVLQNKFGKKDTENPNSIDQEYITKAENIMSNNKKSELDATIKNDIKNILQSDDKSKTYIYSTEALIGKYIDEKLQKIGIDKKPEESKTQENNWDDASKSENSKAETTTPQAEKNSKTKTDTTKKSNEDNKENTTTPKDKTPNNKK